VLSRNGSAEEVRAFQAQFRKLEIRALVYGLIVIQRRAELRTTFTVRRPTSGGVLRQPEIEWLMAWETAAAQGDIADRILRLRLAAPAACELRTIHQLQAGEWTPSGYLLSTEHPFPMESKTQPAIAQMLARCD